jgi:DNA helicase II / ATP-dependent DNA helicase PcrA
MQKYLDGLNTEQMQAVTSTEGPLLILAGAGTGKTKTLISRITHLIHSGTDASRILAVTFTNKAAAEMRERIKISLESGTVLPQLCTFHSLGVQMLRQWHEKIGLKSSFSILDTDDQISMMKIIMEIEHIDTKEWDARELVRSMSSLRMASSGNLETIESRSSRDDMVKTLWRAYQSRKKKDGAVDFDDLIELPVRLLRENPEVQSYYHKKYQYIHVDEYQDTSDLQYEMIHMLLGSHMNLCVVGDGDQTIYTWRGATMRNILQFTTDFPGATMIALTKNYRSTQTILDAANTIIAQNIRRIPKDLITDSGFGTSIQQYHAFDESDEASWVAETIMQLQIKHDISLNEIGILYRSHYQSRAIEETLVTNSIPYTISGTKFFDRREVRDLMAYLRCALVSRSLVDMKRVCETPKRGIGKVAWAHICSDNITALSGTAGAGYNKIQSVLGALTLYARDHQPSEIVKYAITESGLRGDLMADHNPENMERLANIEELVTFASRYDGCADTAAECMVQFFDSAALLAESDSSRRETNTEAVHMLTVHSAKGLEFDCVFLVGLEEGIFPSDIGAGTGDRDDEEERRLMYVAVTRARQYLHISHAMSRRIYGQTRFQRPSVFVSDIPSHLIHQIGENSMARDNTTEFPESLLDW